MKNTLIHYELRGPFYDVIVMSSIAQYNCDVTKRATQLIVYQGGHSLGAFFLFCEGREKSGLEPD